MPRLRNKATGVVVNVSDETAKRLDGYEPADTTRTTKRTTSKAATAPAAEELPPSPPAPTTGKASK